MKIYSLKALLKDSFHETLSVEDRLTLALQSAGFKPVTISGLSDDFITWQNTKTEENAIMDGWEGAQDYLEETLNSLGLSDLQKEKISLLIDDKYIHNSHTLNNPTKMVQVIAQHEIDNNIPDSERLTNWFGDIALYESKLGVSEEQIKLKYMQLKYPEVSLETSQSITIAADEEPAVSNDLSQGNKTQESKNYAAAENTQKEKLDQLNNQIKDLVESYKTNPEHIAELLAFKESFYKYSINNTMLVYDQNPNATFVQSYDAWKRDGYNVLKGQKGLKVLVPTNVTYLKVPGTDKLVQLSHAPDLLKDMYKAHNIESIQKKFFKVGNVFDISQTDVPKENYPEYYSMGYKSSDYDNVIAGISRYSQEKLNCPVTIKDLQSIALRGCYFPIDNTIELNNLLESSEKISTLTHELGHAVLHNDPDLKISASQIEFEADCMSIMLESHFGIPLADARKEHISTHYKKLASELSTEDIEVDFKGILSDVFSKYESMIEDIDHYVSEEISKSQELNNLQTSEDIDSPSKFPEQLQDIDEYIPSESLVNRMLETESNINLEGLEYALEA